MTEVVVVLRLWFRDHPISFGRFAGTKTVAEVIVLGRLRFRAGLARLERVRVASQWLQFGLR